MHNRNKFTFRCMEFLRCAVKFHLMELAIFIVDGLLLDIVDLFFLESNPNNSVVVRSLFEMIEECKIYLFSFRFSVASHHWYFNCWKISMIYYYWMMMDIVTNYFARLNFIALIDDWISQVVLISLPWFTLQDIIKSSSQTEKI